MILLNKIDIYIIKNILISFFIVLFALLSLEFIGRLIAEADIIGKNNYNFIKVITYILAIIPLKLVDFFPIALLIGSLIGLGKLNSTNELIIIQNMGISKARIGFIGCIISLFLGFIFLLIIEFFAVSLNDYAKTLRANALNENKQTNISGGIWAQDKNSFINIGGIAIDGGLADINIYSFDDNLNFKSVRIAKSAKIASNGWELLEVNTKTIENNNIYNKKDDYLIWKNNLNYKIIKLLLIEPNELSIRDLKQFISYQKRNYINPKNHILVFWQHIFIPLTATVMFLLALPFVFSSNRNSNQGKKLFIGVLLGLIYFISYSSISNLILLIGINPIIGALLPIILFLIVSLILLRAYS